MAAFMISSGRLPLIIAAVAAMADCWKASGFSLHMRASSPLVTFHMPPMPIRRMAITALVSAASHHMRLAAEKRSREDVLRFIGHP